MPFDVLSNTLGLTQGRLQAIGAPEGSYVFVLGSVGLPAEYLEIGDYVEVKQTADITGKTFVQFVGRVVPPTSLPVGYGWRASLRVGGVERTGRILYANRTRTFVDMKANVSHLTGNQELAFRLAVVSV